jgi:hypothetical protein
MVRRVTGAADDESFGESALILQPAIFVATSSPWFTVGAATAIA